MWQRWSPMVMGSLCMWALAVQAAPVVFESSGNTTAASIQATVDAYRAALGTLNPNTPGSFASGRREINWDANGPLDPFASPTAMPNGFFNAAAAPFARGAFFTTPGVGNQVLVSQDDNTGADADPDQVRFSDINPTYASTFSVFSLQRLFQARGSSIIDMTFFVPGSALAATTSGFGAIFTDVDLADSSRLDFFDLNDTLLFSRTVLPGTVADGSLSFLGVLFDAGERIARVRITAGNTPLGPDDDPARGIDIVALDDFIYGEPQVVPEPTTLALCSGGVLVLWGLRRRQQRRARQTSSDALA